MKKNLHASLFYEKLGADGLEFLAQKWHVNDDVQTAKALLSKDDKILDIGCGYGRVAVPLAEAGFDVTGLDISNKLIKEARRRTRKKDVSARFDVGDMRDLPYKDETFNKIISFWNSFNELLTKRGQIKALNEMFRVLKKGGMAFIVTRNGESKELRKEVKGSGLGEDGRILKEELEGLESVVYIHNRKTLSQICKKSKFKKYRTFLKNMNKQKRLVMCLYK